MIMQCVGHVSPDELEVVKICNTHGPGPKLKR